MQKDAHTKQQIMKQQMYKTADHETVEGTKRHKLKTAKAQNGRRHKTAEGTNRQEAQNGRFKKKFCVLRYNVQENRQFY